MAYGPQERPQVPGRPTLEPGQVPPASRWSKSRSLPRTESSTVFQLAAAVFVLWATLHSSAVHAARQNGPTQLRNLLALPDGDPPGLCREPVEARQKRNAERVTVAPRLPPPAKSSGSELPAILPAHQFTAHTQEFGPPDIQAALSPDHVVVATNWYVRVLRRSGELLAAKSTYWLMKDSVFDPGLVRDPASGRWILTASLKTGIAVAVSVTSDPLGDWAVRVIDLGLTPHWWFDQPRIGLQKPGLLICGALLSTKTDDSVGRCLLVPVPQLLSNAPLTDVLEYGGLSPMLWPVDDPDLQLDRPLAIEARTDKAGLQLLGLHFRLTDLAPETVATLWVQQGAQPILADAPQAGGPAIDAGFTQPRCVARLDRLWCTWNAQISGEVALLAGVAPANGSLALLATPDAAGVVRAYPSPAVSPAGDFLIGYTRFSADTWPSAAYALRLAGDPTGTLRPEVVAKKGLAAFNAQADEWDRVRWGDYTASLADPEAPDTLWTFQEYAEAPVSAPSRFGVAAVAVRVPCSAVVCGECERCAQGQCSPAPSGAVCNDGDGCTLGDTCLDGLCTGKPRVCTGSSTCIAGYQCRSSDGACVPQPVAGKPVCDDGDPCTVDNHCEGGACLGRPVLCPSDGCHLAYCSGVTGTCVSQLLGDPACVPPAPPTGCSAGGAGSVWPLLATAGLVCSLVAMWRLRHQRKNSLAWVWLLSLGACQPPEDPRLSAVATFGRFAEQLRSRACLRIGKCSAVHDLFADIAHCDRYFQQHYAYGLYPLDPHLLYSPKAAADCLDWLDRVIEPCLLSASIYAGDGPCAQVVRGTLPDGADCTWPAHGDRCRSGKCMAAQDQCTGIWSATCAAELASARACAAAKDCAPGEFCTGGLCQVASDSRGAGESCGDMHGCAPNLTCLEGASGGTCVPRVSKPGAACVPGASSPSPCAYPLHCKPGTGGATCSYWATGLPCAGDGDCDQRTVCKQGKCLLKPRLGEHCVVSEGCREVDTTCVAQGGNSVCVFALAEGAACKVNSDTSFACAAGLFCHFGHCRAAASLGDACDDSLPCQVPLVCAAGVCRPPGPLGGTCDSALDCMSGLTCVKGKCVIPPTLGEPCGMGGQCGTDLVCRAGTCGPRMGPGEPCAWDGDCVAGTYCNGAECVATPVCEK